MTAMFFMMVIPFWLMWRVGLQAPMNEAIARAAAYKPRPKTVWLVRLLSTFRAGVDVRDEAKPAPMAGCMTNSGNATVVMPNPSAGQRLGARSQSRACQRSQQQGKGDTGDVVRGPAQRYFAAHGRRLGDGLVVPLATRHVTDPAAEQGEIERWQAEDLEQREPQVHQSGGTNADGDGAGKVCIEGGHEVILSG
jgi:hypothetical protein